MRKNNNKPIFAVAVAVLFISASCQQQASPAPDVKKTMETAYNRPLNVGNKTIKVELVSTPEKMSAGLSGREPLTESEGMLFKFDKKNTTSFWMKDMKFNLDIIWIADGKIIGISKNTPAPALRTADTELPSYYPPAPYDTVLEVLGGWVDRNEIKIGDQVSLQ